ncbi:MAG: C4-dicarboxylate TRAP transporter substrate-binding protein [Clostridiales bacterium]|nr:C4-dicarboxylate TRAP transporter substrate-binding protein [Clostridiales bacterium]
MKKSKIVAIGMAAVMVIASVTGCSSGSSSSSSTTAAASGTTAAAAAETTAAAKEAPAANKEKITLRIGSGHSESNPWITALEDYFVANVSERVSAETNYEIDWVKSYGGSVISLGNELQGVQDGLVDIGCTILVFEASRLPLQTMVYSMPFSCSDPLIVAETIKQIYAEYPEFTTDYETGYNQKFIGIGVSDPYGFYSTKEVKSLDDVNGMKIGAAGINLSWIEGSGAVGVQTSLNDTYQNLQTNVCQATIQPTRSCVNLKVYEVAPYYLDANFNVVPFNAITVNLDTWNDLPAEIQTILSEVGEGYLDYEAAYINEVHEEDLKTLADQGCTITDLSREEQEKWAASLPDVVNGLVKSLNDSGYKGAEIVSRYYEILESQGVEKVRDWDISD